MALSTRRCTVLATVVLALTCNFAHATVNQSMQDWFNEIGAYGNVTGPNAYRGQTMNMYTGGPGPQLSVGQHLAAVLQRRMRRH